ncbi:akirin-like [Scaptodrosophila lebanonensis]|uniref:Akirin-like n=1 Tax=Drosophila lebanonensis TaxID=7225 RepID=A0A6J2U9Z5_DROLE|nr:akirin-like [Scaptodrosophila lebanonensis]
MDRSTRKRALAWEFLDQGPVKRRCCNISSGRSEDHFESLGVKDLPAGQLAAKLCHEMKRLSDGEEMPIHHTSGALKCVEDPIPDAVAQPHFPQNAKPENALFSINQVELICKGILQEFEDQLHESYQSVLQKKLAEQHDAFVRFTYEQIRRRFKHTPSYLS